jgi:hypothetical protein
MVLPKGFKDLQYRIYRFENIDQYLNDFTDRPIYKTSVNDIIGKIKSVWVNNDGAMMIAGYLTKKK